MCRKHFQEKLFTRAHSPGWCLRFNQEPEAPLRKQRQLSKVLLSALISKSDLYVHYAL